MAKREPRTNSTEFYDTQIRLISNARWDEIFQILEFMMNDIFPDDFNQYATDKSVRTYFKNKYQIKLR